MPTKNKKSKSSNSNAAARIIQRVYISKNTSNGRNICQICQNNLTKDDVIALKCYPTLKISHRFHQSCILDWRSTLIADKKPTTCPTCRTDISSILEEKIREDFIIHITEIEKQRDKLEVLTNKLFTSLINGKDVLDTMFHNILFSKQIKLDGKHTFALKYTSILQFLQPLLTHVDDFKLNEKNPNYFDDVPADKLPAYLNKYIKQYGVLIHSFNKIFEIFFQFKKNESFVSKLYNLLKQKTISTFLIYATLVIENKKQNDLIYDNDILHTLGDNFTKYHKLRIKVPN
jgi:hypothetical protein